MTTQPNLSTCTRDELITWAKETNYLNLQAWADTTMSDGREYTDDEIYTSWANACIGEAQMMSAS